MDREEQIEEIAVELWRNTAIREAEICDDAAEHLYNAGYRKQIEGEWIEDEVEEDCPTHFFHNYTCSVFGNHEQDRSPYCCECGAKMKGE